MKPRPVSIAKLMGLVVIVAVYVAVVRANFAYHRILSPAAVVILTWNGFAILATFHFVGHLRAFSFGFLATNAAMLTLFMWCMAGNPPTAISNQWVTCVMSVGHHLSRLLPAGLTAETLPHGLDAIAIAHVFALPPLFMGLAGGLLAHLTAKAG